MPPSFARRSTTSDHSENLLVLTTRPPHASPLGELHLHPLDCPARRHSVRHIYINRPPRASPLVEHIFTTRPLARLQTAKSFYMHYILLFPRSRISRNSHITFTRRPHHRVCLYARLLIFTYLLSTGYLTPESNFHFNAYVIHEHHVFFMSSLHRPSGAATQSEHYTTFYLSPAL
jgi:hypothetical protein